MEPIAHDQEPEFSRLVKMINLSVILLILTFISGIFSFFLITPSPDTQCSSRSLGASLLYIFSLKSPALLAHTVIVIALLVVSVVLTLVSLKSGIIFWMISGMAVVAQIMGSASGMFLVTSYFHNQAFSLVMVASFLMSVILYMLILFIAKNYKRLNI